MTRRVSLPLDRRRKHKYRAVATVVDGIRFASKKEATRYGELKMLEKAGEIVQLRLQPSFELCCPDWAPPLFLGVESTRGCPVVGSYRADFHYYDKRLNKFVVEDVKGFRTPMYRWKKRHLELQHGIEIREV